jgi:hypothetical protein
MPNNETIELNASILLSVVVLLSVYRGCDVVARDLVWSHYRPATCD